MSDLPLFNNYTIIYTKFDNVAGLLSGNSVTVKGFKIGSVKEMKLLENDSTLVTLSIGKDFPIPVGSKAYLKSTGLLGEKYISLEKSLSSKTIPKGGYIVGVFDKGVMDTFAEEGSKLSKDISKSIGGIEVFVDNLNSTLTDENKESISNTLSNVSASTDSINLLINKRKSTIDSMIVGAKDMIQHFDDLSVENKEQLSQFISNLEKTSSNLEKLSSDLNETSKTLDGILAKINNGEGSLGKLLNEPGLYNNLDSLTINLNDLVKNIKEDPRRYLKHMRLVDLF